MVFNNIHNKLQFTIKQEKNRSLNFLDLSLIVIDDTIILDWYQKNTCSSRYLSYFSSHPLCYKIGTIYGLVDRAVLLFTSNFSTKKFGVRDKGIIRKYPYPIDLIFSKMNYRIKKLIRKLFVKKTRTKIGKKG